MAAAVFGPSRRRTSCDLHFLPSVESSWRCPKEETRRKVGQKEEEEDDKEESRLLGLAKMIHTCLLLHYQGVLTSSWSPTSPRNKNIR